MHQIQRKQRKQLTKPQKTGTVWKNLVLPSSICLNCAVFNTSYSLISQTCFHDEILFGQKWWEMLSSLPREISVGTSGGIIRCTVTCVCYLQQEPALSLDHPCPRYCQTIRRFHSYSGWNCYSMQRGKGRTLGDQLMEFT